MRGGEDDGRHGLKLLKLARVALADASLVRGDAADIVGILLHQVGVEIVERAAHLVGVLLVDAEDDRLGEAIGLFQEVGEVAGDRFGAGVERDGPLEVLRLVLLVGDLAAVAIELALARAPAGGVPRR